MFARASSFNALVGMAVDVVSLFMALLSFRGIDTPSLPAQGEQRRPIHFNIDRDISEKRHRAGGKMAVRANLFPRPRGCDRVPAHRLPFRAAAFGVLPTAMESPRLRRMSPPDGCRARRAR